MKVLVAQLCPTLCNPMDCISPMLLCLWNSPGKNTGVGSHSLLQGIFPTKGLNPSLLHCRRDSLPSEPLGKLLTFKPDYLPNTIPWALRLQHMDLEGWEKGAQTFNLKHHNSLKLLVVTNLGDKSLGSIAEIRIHSTSD